MIIRFCATIVFLLLAGGDTFAAPHSTPALAESFTYPEAKVPAPNLLFKDADGQEHTLQKYMKSELKGRFALLILWATWCLPCAKEMPSLDRLQEVMGPRLAVVALAQDHDGLHRVPAYFRRHNITHLQVYADQNASASRILRLRGLPASLLIDPMGYEVGRVFGSVDWMAPANLAYLEKLMGLN